MITFQHVINNQKHEARTDKQLIGYIIRLGLVNLT